MQEMDWRKVASIIRDEAAAQRKAFLQPGGALETRTATFVTSVVLSTIADALEAGIIEPEGT